MQPETSEDSAFANVVKTPRKHDAYSAFRIRDFRFMLAGTMIVNLGMLMQSTALGWEIYERTGSEWLLGMVGLAQILPVFALVWLTGHVADRYDRRRIILMSLVVIASCSLGLAWVSHRHAPIAWVYVLLFVIGVGRAFMQPARAAFLPQLVPAEHFNNAVTWNSGGFQIASVVGPALGGWMIWWTRGAQMVYLLDAITAMIYFVLLLNIQSRPVVRSATPTSMAVATTAGPISGRSLAEGIAFLRATPVVLGAMTLDLFAVLLGGATILLPVYAKDILGVGPKGLGWMRAMDAVGALLMALFMAHRRPLERAGRSMLWAVAGFGVATIVFGVSRWYWLSLLMLFAIGALDNIGVVVRQTLVQMKTPDEMRGRVSAINSMFIGASNELGGFESGAVAALTTPTFSVVFGGIGTLIVVALIAVVFPQLRKYGRLVEPATTH
ncbi:MAG: MFS transporter [Phycisphaerae bacterium]|nr:MFS transporter [Phycisphaerae bacterium]